jgi:hypothetical protein
MKSKIGKNRVPTNADHSLGRKIRLRRAELKLSQGDLGGKLGVSFRKYRNTRKASIASAPPV